MCTSILIKDLCLECSSINLFLRQSKTVSTRERLRKRIFSSNDIKIFFIERFIPVIIFSPRAIKRRNKSLLIQPLSANKNPFILAVISGTTDRSSTLPFVSFAFIKFSLSSMCNLNPKNQPLVDFLLFFSSYICFFFHIFFQRFQKIIYQTK